MSKATEQDLIEFRKWSDTHGINSRFFYRLSYVCEFYDISSPKELARIFKTIKHPFIKIQSLGRKTENEVRHALAEDGYFGEKKEQKLKYLVQKMELWNQKYGYQHWEVQYRLNEMHDQGYRLFSIERHGHCVILTFELRG